MRIAAGRNDNACLGSRTPRLASRANTLTSLTIVISGSRTVSRNIVASVSQRTPRSVRSESQASAAVVVSGATGRDSNTGSLSRTPREVGFANAFSGLTVMAGRTNRWNVVARVGSSAPSSSG